VQHHEGGCPRLRGVRSLGAVLPTSGDFPDPQFGFLKLVYENWSRFVIGVVAEAAPGPVLRLFDQSAFHRIAMDIPQLFQSLAL